MRISDWSSYVCSSDLIAAGRFSPQLPTRIYDDGFPVSKVWEDEPRNAVIIRLGISLPDFKSEEAAIWRKGKGMLTRRSIARRPYIAKSHEILGHKRTNDRWGFRLRPVDVRAQGRRRIASWCRGSDANQRSHERAHSYQRFTSVTLIVRPRRE